MSFHFPHLPARRPRHRVITPAGDPVLSPRDVAFFKALHAEDAQALAPHPVADPAHIPTGLERRAALTMRVPSRPPGPPRTAHGIRIVSNFFADPAFAEPLREFIRSVHQRGADMASAFDMAAERIERQHHLGDHFAAARRDGANLAARYAQGGTASMTDLVAQARARIVADALTGGTR